MEKEWLIIPKDRVNNRVKDPDTKLLDILNQIEDGRGWRFTEEQADTLAKLADNLIEHIKEYNKKRNKGRKRRHFIFLK